jgi:hypothetical protein
VSLVSRDKREFTISNNATLATNTGQEIEYALTLNSSQAPGGAFGTIQEWKTGSDSLTWAGLAPDTEYYVWARSKESSTYSAGIPKMGGPVTTVALTEWEQFLEDFIIESAVGAPFSPTFASGPAHGKVKGAFGGGVLAPNGKVILAPWRDAVGIYDPVANTYTNGPAHGRGYGAFTGGVLAPNGKVILVPWTSANVGIYDPVANTYTNGPAHGKGGEKFFAGGVLAPNGKVILAPCSSANVGIYDPVANTYTNGPAHGKGSFAFAGGVLAPNGKVILVPYSSANVGIYDPVANTFASGPAHGQGSYAFAGGVLAPNGKVILVPWGSANVCILTTGLERSLNTLLSPFVNKF